MEDLVTKPWGCEVIWAKTDKYVGKMLFINAGESLSRQYHEKKDETILMLSGRIRFEYTPVGETAPVIVYMVSGDSCHIPPGTIHRMAALEHARILEVSTPELDDVVRLEDKYGRA